jgi:acyl transferase domain-containing protein/thioesterase domain-containing protein
MNSTEESLSLSPAIAVIGMAGRFPGARNVTEFWENLRGGKESILDLTDDELKAAGIPSELLNDTNYVKRAVVLEGLEGFDAPFFGFSPKDAAIMDPQHRVFLESAWEALEYAGWDPNEFSGSIGVYAGSGFNTYLIYNLLPNQQLMNTSGLFLIKQTGNDKDVLATRVSYQLNLTGPSITVQTACSTSLVAIHLASQSLLNHECDMAIAGGVTIEFPHRIGYLYRDGEILSRDGHCRSFDARSSGTVFGSGAGVVVLRRLEDALKDGDCIHAIILGTAINNDGSRKAGYLAPSVNGQSDVIVEALSVAGVDADSISYVETHGTGTSIGDPIEVTALTQAFRQSTEKCGFCAIGSVKSNIGHLDAAAGVAGFIKTVLALRNKELPPSLHFSSPNPLIDFQNSPFYVNNRLTDWKCHRGRRRAGVTSLGIGGTNAHVILEEAPPAEQSGASRRWQTLTISSKTATALESATTQLAEYLVKHPSLNLADVAYTCHRGRKAFAHRRAVVCASLKDAIHALRGGDPKRVLTAQAAEKASAVFLFSGQGSQYAGMGKDLYDNEADFRSQVDLCSEILHPQLGLDLRTILYPSSQRSPEADELLGQTWITQPALFVIEFALASLWISWGIRPAAMIGHSLGELVAACHSGVLSLEAALTMVAIRGRLMRSLSGGSMLAVNLSEQEAGSLLGKNLSLAGVNAPDQCVLSGPADAIDEIQQFLSQEGKYCHRLHTSHAFHSAAMEGILEPFTEAVRGLALKPPTTPFISNVTGEWIRAEEATDPTYWARHLRQPVRFSDGLRVILKQSPDLLIEIGPGRVLGGLTQRHLVKGTKQKVLSSLRGPKESGDDIQHILTTLSQFWASGMSVDWVGFHAYERRHRVPLPTYPFEHQRHWIEAAGPSGTPVKEIESTGSRQDASLSYYAPAWIKTGLRSDARAQLTGPWLIFLDSLSLGRKTATILNERGAKTICVKPGVKFARLRPDQYQVNPGSRSDFNVLITELVNRGDIPGRILHFWAITEPTGSLQALESLDDTQERCFHSLAFLAQAIGERDLSQRIELGIVSNGLQSVAGEAINNPERAILLGPCKVIPREFVNISSRWVDVAWTSTGTERRSSANDVQNTAQEIVDEFSSENTGSVVAYRNNSRWVQTIERAGVDQKRRGFRQQGVYLITGGLGGIGFAVAEFLARSVRARLVLIDRTNLLPKSEWVARRQSDHNVVGGKLRKIHALEALGGEVLLVHGDVTNLADMQRAISEARQKWGTIHGVIHGAGAIDDGLIQLLDKASADRILAPKVKGTMVLQAVLEKAELDFFVLFSSVSNFIAPVGQVAYVGANASQDAFAQAMHSQNRRHTIAINWARWRDVGLAVDRAQPLQFRTLETEAGPPDSKRHPWLGRRVLHKADATAYLNRLRFEDHWVLNEHRFHDREGLFPGTGYIELAWTAAQEFFGPGAIRLENLSFSAPFMVASGQTKGIQTDLMKDGDAYRFSVTAKSPDFAKHGSQTLECASGLVGSLGQIPPETIPIPEILRRCQLRELIFTPDVQNLKQARYIYFGPRWRCLRRIWFGNGEAVSISELPERFASDLESVGIHPALFDVATGSAMFAIPEYDLTDDLYIPIFYKRLTLRSVLPRSCYCYIRWKHANNIRNDVAIFDMIVTDQSGRIIADIEDFTLRRVSGTTLFSRDFAEPGTGPISMAQQEVSREHGLVAESGIETSEGVGAFAAIMRSEYPPQVIVAPPALKLDDVKIQSGRSLPAALAEGGSHEANSNWTRSDPNDVERSLTEWWQDLLGVKTVGAEDDFFELGGQSLIALRLFSKVKKTYGVDLGLSTLFETRTIEQLSRAIRAAAGTPNQCLVSIKPSGSKPPLFFMHGLNGEVLSYRHIVPHLAHDQPVYGLHAFGVDKNPERFTSIETIAGHYLREIRHLQPRGPYNLCGHSFGGFIAFEIARQLESAGDRVGLLVILDTVTRGLQIHWAFHERLMRVYRRFSHRFRMLRNGKWKGLPAYLRERMTILRGQAFSRRNDVHGESVPQWVEPERQYVAAILLKAVNQWNPKPYRGRVTLFRASDEYGGISFGSKNGWEKLAIGGLDVYEFDADHASIIKESCAPEVAKKLNQLLSNNSQIRNDLLLEPNPGFA